MKLDRNLEKNKGKGKYALIKLRTALIRPAPFNSGMTEVSACDIDYGDPTKEGGDFFVIRIKDKYAAAALNAYANAAYEDNQTEFAHEIFAMAKKAEDHPDKNKPD